MATDTAACKAAGWHSVPDVIVQGVMQDLTTRIWCFVSYSLDPLDMVHQPRCLNVSMITSVLHVAVESKLAKQAIHGGLGRFYTHKYK